MQLIITDKYWEFNTIEVLRVIDGDTYIVKTRVDTGFGGEGANSAQIRLKDIDCPETRTTNLIEKKHGLEALAFVSDLLATYGMGKLQSYKVGQSFNRWVGEIWLKDSRHLGTVIRDAGMVKRDFY
jgi:endonuclease YncB( thermonuclease family)